MFGAQIPSGRQRGTGVQRPGPRPFAQLTTPVKIADEITAALRTGSPVVALETSVIAHGLPFPRNLEAAEACLQAVGAAGAIPAAIGVIAGEIRVGLHPSEIERLADPASKAFKLGSSDLAIAISQRWDGGTTVSATCEIAARVGISFFATGGIGGVHRGVDESFDISQDLWALSRFPVAVVCAGAKIVLDLPKTVEALEAAGIPIVGIGTSEFPAFFSARSGIPLPYHLKSIDDAARLADVRFGLGQGGILFVQPPPEEYAFPFAEIDGHVRRAVSEASARKISGKAVTPFLLQRLEEATQGKTLDLNIKLLANNAGLAARLAGAFTALSQERGQKSTPGSSGFGS